MTGSIQTSVKGLVIFGQHTGSLLLFHIGKSLIIDVLHQPVISFQIIEGTAPVLLGHIFIKSYHNLASCYRCGKLAAIIGKGLHIIVVPEQRSVRRQLYFHFVEAVFRPLL